MIIDLVYKLVQQIANKDEVSGYISPEEFNNAARFVQLEWITENYNPVSKLGYENNNSASDVFSTFKQEVPIIVSNGFITKPNNYLHYSSARVAAEFSDGMRYFPMELVRDYELAERLASEINKPSKRFAILTNQDDGFDVYPQNIDLVNLSYIRTPLDPWWNYTVVSGEPVFAETGGTTTNPNDASNNSTDFELDETEVPYLTHKILKYFGIEVENQLLYQSINNEAKTED